MRHTPFTAKHPLEILKPFEPVVVAIVFNAPIVALPNDAVFARASVEDEKLEKSDGESIELEALLVSDDEGANTKIGAPTVAGAKVTATVMETGKGKKVMVVKYKPKSRYRRKNGHRQPFTKIKIEKIVA